MFLRLTQPHMSHERRVNPRSGFTLLISVLVVGIILAIGLSILTITLKEYLLSGIARESVIALNAADAGIECALYWDHHPTDGNRFDLTPSGPSITCMGQTKSTIPGPSGAAQNFQFNWPEGTIPVCADVTVTKYFSTTLNVPMDGSPSCSPGPNCCPMGIECTVVTSRGYNKACSQLNTPRTVERALYTRF